MRKCPYCDFNSHESKQDLPETAYIDALLRDLEQELPRVWGRTVQSIFIGGGTPSLFSVGSIDRLLSGVRALLPLQPGLEITMEANPGTFEQEKFHGFHALGINRLSIGIQSFNDSHLTKLGRIHSGQEAHKAIAMARHAGFDNINLDLMFGLPEQNLQQALDDLNTALSFKPEHISLYQLTIEPNTLFAHQPPQLPDDDSSWEIQTHCQQALADAGYEHYEVSAYGQSGQLCQHNLNYWQFGDYLGIGAGAHGKISDAAQQSITRTAKQRHPQHYMDNANSRAVTNSQTMISETRLLTRNDVGIEFMMNALRLTGGFPISMFMQHTGQAITLIEKALQQAEQKNLITRDFTTIQPTALGQRYLNDLLTLFMPD